MNKEKSAWRRHHLQKKKRRARAIYKNCSNPEKYANNMKSCSCFLCGNPRKHFGEMTVQEKRVIDSFMHDLSNMIDSKKRA